MSAPTPAVQRLRACASGELPEGRVLTRVVGGRAVALLRRSGEVCAFGALCPHQQADLSGGLLEDGGITCPDHLWHFELPGGRCTSIPGARLPVFPASEHDGVVYVDLVPR
jgi:nitrite reductase/ring-hydroxylating ferredoxin subunit